MPRKYSYAYKVRIHEDTLPELQKLSGKLGFTVTTPGRYLGDPSPAALLDVLAAAYRRDPRGTYLALQGLLDANDLLPARDDNAPDNSAK
jgi:hypothetical protein